MGITCYHLGMLSRFLVFFLCIFQLSFASVFNDEEALIQLVKRAIERAEAGCSKLSEKVLKIEGMSTPKVRHFLNNLCEIEGGSYLEIGVWKGSTTVAALYQNASFLESAIALDNWSEFGGPRRSFIWNIRKFLGKKGVEFHEVDCFSIVPEEVIHTPVNLYFYDGAHSALDQEKGFTHFDSIFDDLFVAIVDDWAWEQVQEGTATAFEKLGYDILFSKELYDGWHNGLFVAVLKKRSQLRSMGMDSPSACD